MNQKILKADENYSELTAYIKANNMKKILLVCGKSLKNLRISGYFEEAVRELEIMIVVFSDFTPNPSYESVVKGIDLYHQEQCDSIIAVGGGSAMDVAKCIKLYSNMNRQGNYLEQKIVPNLVQLIAVPTTAGSGSEATRFAVIYYEGEKQSVADDSCIPAAVLMDASTLHTLPSYQKKATMLDAFCHAVEAFWSVNSTEESKLYSEEAIKLILENMAGYLENKEEANIRMLQAANIAGKAINITQTTAGHAMCYKLTGLYGISHGHAAALCVSKVWAYMIRNTEMCIDIRGKDYLDNMFLHLAKAMGCRTAEESADKFQSILKWLGLQVPVCEEKDFSILKNSVNPIRLKNNPVRLNTDEIDVLYHQILDKGVE